MELKAQAKGLGLSIATVFCAIVALAILFSSVRISWNESRDFPQYFAAARLYLSGQSARIYDHATLSTLEHSNFPNMPKDTALFCYPPYALPCFAWLGLLPPSLAQKIWTIISLSALTAALAMFAREFEYNLRSLMLAVALCFASGPLCEALIKGQPTCFMLLGLAVSLLALKRNVDWLAALALTILLPKPHLLLPVVAFLLGARRWKVVTFLGAFAALLLLVSLPAATTAGYTAYYEFMRTSGSDPLIMNLRSCPTLRSQVFRFLPNPTYISTTVSLVAYGIMTAFCAWTGHSERNNKSQQLMSLSLVVLPLSAAFAIYFQAYDALLLVPSLFYLPQVLVSSTQRSLGTALAIVGVALLFAPTYAAVYHAQIAFHPHFWLLLAFATLCASACWKMEKKETERALARSE